MESVWLATWLIVTVAMLVKTVNDVGLPASRMRRSSGVGVRDAGTAPGWGC